MREANSKRGLELVWSETGKEKETKKETQIRQGEEEEKG